MKKSIKVLSLILVFAMLMCNVAVFASADSAPLNYLVLGDSIGWGAGVLNSEQACYGKIVADTNGYAYVNDAVNGYTTKDLIEHLAKDKVAEDVRNADIISLSIGGNNFLLANLPKLIINAKIKNDYSQFDEIIADFYIDFDIIINTISTLNPDAVILVQTLYNPRYDFLRDAYQQGTDRLNSSYHRYLDENPDAYIIVDVATAFLDKEDYIASDKIHPNAKGNEEIAKLVLSTLFELGLGENTEPVISNAGVDQFNFSLESLVGLFKFFLNRIMSLFSRA